MAAPNNQESQHRLHRAEVGNHLGYEEGDTLLEGVCLGGLYPHLHSGRTSRVIHRDIPHDRWAEAS